jgi:L-rhamnonate dehydratase
VPWLEYFFEAAPGISLEDSRYMPGQAVAHGGRLVPSDAPGFGQGIEAEWLTPFFT